MANKKNTLQVVVGSILILLLIGVTVLLISEKRANNELVQEFNLERKTWKTSTPTSPSSTMN